MRGQKRDFSGLLRARARKLGLAAALLTLTGCPLRKPAPPPPELPQTPLPTAIPQPDAGITMVAQEDGTRVSEFDLDHDGRVELRIYAAPTDGGTRLLRKELDMNGDGSPDLHKLYGEDGALARETYDANFDGTLDAISDYRAGERVRTERDEDGDGLRETVVLYEAEQVTRVERDLDGDGRPDLREEWRAGRVIERLWDEDGDGSWSPVQATEDGGTGG